MIWIRADANKEIGSGHVMRCLSIAEALRECGEEVCFIVADEAAGVLLSQKGQCFQVLHTTYNQMEAELPILLELLEREAPKLLLLDSYFVTEAYLQKLREYVKVAYLDDIPRFAYPVDMLINYNIYGDALPYRETAAVEGQKLLLGPSYAPLRRQFREVIYEVGSKAEHILITTGGSDKYNLAGQILGAVLSCEETADLHYHVVSGAFNPHLPDLQVLAEEHKNVHLYSNVADMAGLMRQCDIAITAGGSTTYELCAIGVPFICFSFVDNQELIVENFYKKQLVAYGGNFLTEGEQFAANVLQALLTLLESKALRQEYSSRERLLVDGQGAVRIAMELKRLADESN